MPADSTGSSGNHIKALDGVRGLAVALVLLFHSSLLPVGWVGVQLFFVLSGFLITRILLDGRKYPLRFALARFWWRRALRILPVFLVFLAAAGLAYLLWGVPASFPHDAPWLASFLANFGRLRPEDLGHAFVHMWSLALEEQFYLIWPFIVLMLPIKHLGRLIWVLLLGIPLLRLAMFEWAQSWGYGSEYAGRAVYVLPWSHLDAFAAGGALALWRAHIPHHPTRLVLIALGLLAFCGAAAMVSERLAGGGIFLAALGYPMFLIPAAGYFWGYTVLNVACAMLLAAVMHESAWSRLFSSGPLVALGRISYGLYVYHLPILLLFRYWIPGEPGSPWAWENIASRISGIVASVVVALLSYRWLEKPILALKDRAYSRVTVGLSGSQSA